MHWQQGVSIYFLACNDPDKGIVLIVDPSGIDGCMLPPHRD